MLSIVLLGAPGAGKGTYAARVSERIGILPISTGEIFRRAIRSGSALGEEVKSYVESGKLVPDDVLRRVLEARLSEPDCAKGFLLDGYPRTAVQARDLDGILESMGTGLSLVIAIEADEEMLVKRLGGRRSCPKCGSVYNVYTLKPATDGACDKCGTSLVTRPDDEPETIRKRFALYQQQSAPLAAMYRERGLLKSIQASLPLDTAVGRIVEMAQSAAGA